MIGFAPGTVETAAIVLQIDDGHLVTVHPKSDDVVRFISHALDQCGRYAASEDPTLEILAPCIMACCVRLALDPQPGFCWAPDAFGVYLPPAVLAMSDADVERILSAYTAINGRAKARLQQAGDEVGPPVTDADVLHLLGALPKSAPVHERLARLSLAHPI